MFLLGDYPAKLALVTCFTAPFVVACVNTYEEPSVESPHALVKVQLAYHSHPGTQLDESVRLNDHDVVFPLDETQRATPVIREVRIRPKLAVWKFSSSFSHSSTSSTMQSGSPLGTGSTMRSAPVVSTYSTSDGACHVSMALNPQAGDVYSLQYDYLTPNQCTLRCTRVLPAGSDQSSDRCPIVSMPKP